MSKSLVFKVTVDAIEKVTHTISSISELASSATSASSGLCDVVANIEAIHQDAPA